jgi:prolyl-tRNA synthetase
MNADRSKLPDPAADFPAWYGEVVRRAELAENGPARGSMVIRPYGYAIWERLQAELDARIKATGHENVYFPLLVPTSLLEREAEHVAGFSPQVAVVTHGGGKKLAEPLAIRPTSEALMWATYARWIESYDDLPLLYNQWANVLRWELRTRLFLRTSEFLWQEGHTAHETAGEALAEALTILRAVYRDVAEEVMAMPVVLGRKTASERFPGAVETFSMEALMRDGKALQAGTSHYLGENFARAYDVRFTGRDGRKHYAQATSWGASTRLVGGLIMAHGDEAGLRLPPALAPFQAVVVPIGGELEAAERLARALRGAGVRVRVDAREGRRPGFKFHEWELKGVPVRLELGPRDLAAGGVSVAVRGRPDRLEITLDSAAEQLRGLLADVQRELYERAAEFRAAHTLFARGYEEMREYLAAATGFAVAGWCGSERCEERAKTDAKATIRCLPLDEERVDEPCVVCGGPAAERAYWAQAY